MTAGTSAGDAAEPEGRRRATAPTARRPPSQSDIHGISTIASVPAAHDRRPPADDPPRGDPADDPPQGDPADRPPREDR